MATQKIMRGDTYPIFFKLTQDETNLTPSMLADVEICVGEELNINATEGRIGYDDTLAMWYFQPAQDETLAMEADTYDVIARVKYPNGYVKGVSIGKLMVLDTYSEDVM